MRLTVDTGYAMPRVEVRVVIDRVLGAATIFRQGGSLRLILPKKSSKVLKMTRDPEESDFSTVILILTNRGILMRSLEDYLGDKEMSAGESSNIAID